MFSSLVFWNTEIIDILIPVRGFYAPSLVFSFFSVSFKDFRFFFPKFGNLVEERYRRNPETVISVTMFIVNFTVCFCLIFVVAVVVFF